MYAQYTGRCQFKLNPAREGAPPIQYLPPLVVENTKRDLIAYQICAKNKNELLILPVSNLMEHFSSLLNLAIFCDRHICNVPNTAKEVCINNNNDAC